MGARGVGTLTDAVPINSDSAELADYVGVLRRQKWPIIGVALAGALLGAVIGLQQPTTYTSTATVLIQPIAASPLERLSATQQALEIETERVLAQSLAVARIAAEQMDTDAPPRTLLERVAVTAPSEAQILHVSFTATDPENARDGAQAFADAYLEFRRGRAESVLTPLRESLEARVSDLESQFEATADELSDLDEEDGTRLAVEGRRDALVSRIISAQEQLAQLGLLNSDPGAVIAPASLPTAPGGPKVPMNVALGIGLGLFAGVLLGFLRDRTDDRVRDISSLRRVVPTAVLTPLPKKNVKAERGVALLNGADDLTAESYRRLRSHVLRLAEDSGVHNLMVGSPVETDDRTAVAANLAVVLAQAGKRVVVVGVDQRSPRIEDQFGLPEGVGLTEVLTGRATLADALQRVDGGGGRLRVMSRGSAAAALGDVLKGGAGQHLLDELRTSCDVVIFDAPPVLAGAEALELAAAGYVDAVLVVVESAVTELGMVVETVRQLEQANVPVMTATLLGRN